MVSVSAEGLIYNGLVKSEKIRSGQELLQKIDDNELTLDDIHLPNMNEIQDFMAQLFVPKSYPIHNHRGKILFAGDGAEGGQAILYQMYLLRKLPQQPLTYLVSFEHENLKTRFYEEVVFASRQTDELPIVWFRYQQKA